MADPRNEVFQAARAYFGAAARYSRAMRTGADLETPTQELVGHGIFYAMALRGCAGQPAFARRRLRAVQRMIDVASRMYRYHARLRR